jgi:methionyl-tRNA formyltransferase
VHLLRVIRLGRAFAFVGDRRLRIESASAFDGSPVASGSISLHDGRVLLGASDGTIVLERVRPESAKSMSALAWWAGGRFEQNVALWT